MKRNVLNGIGKIMLALVLVVFAFTVSDRTVARASSGQTIRVSTAKELKAAIGNPDVSTIILRTKAYADITIKSSKAAAEKTLIVDSINASVVNKAVFNEIIINSARSYTEMTSGNSITVNGWVQDGITVSKKKQVKKLTLISAFFSARDYVLKKGAKIGELELIYGASTAPVKSTFDKSARQLSLKFMNEYECEQDFTIKLDKSGRMTRVKCKSDGAEFECDYSYKYDSDGNIVKISGDDNESGVYVTTFTYSGGLPVKYVTKGGFQPSTTDCTYDENGRLVSYEYHGTGSIDGVEYDVTSIETYEYDSKGRVIYESYENTESGYLIETSYTYNSKGFLTKEVIYSGTETVHTYKYNKAGDLIEDRCVSEGYDEVTEYKYDKLGEPVYDE